MIRGTSLVLAVGLVILWIVGLSQHATPWLTWLDVIGALCGFAIAVGVGTVATRTFGASAPIALAVGLGILWIIGLATHAVLWLTWWTFGFACAFLLLGIIAGTAGDRVMTIHRTHPHPV